MIGRLNGVFEGAHGAQALIDVGGVGYVVSCSAQTLRQCPAAGASVTLLIETQVREDAISLFGFIDSAERSWFRMLTTVQGVGARVALNILGALNPQQLAQVIAMQDKAKLTQAEGVGPKLAARIVTELKDKANGLEAVPLTIQETQAVEAGDRITGDALSALVNLGYRRAEAYDAVLQTRKTSPDANIEVLIREALRFLSLGERAA